MASTVGFDATAASRQSAGIGRYTRQLLAALAGRDDEIEYRLYSLTGGRVSGHLPPLDSRFHHRSILVPDRLMNIVWQRARIPVPVQLFTGGFDLFHSPDFTLPPVSGKPTILTIHDLAFLTTPECAHPALRSYLAEMVPRSVRRADHVVAVSERTRQDVIDLLGVDPKRVTTVLEGVGPEFGRLPSDRVQKQLDNLGVREPYILTVGTLEPRKNHVTLLEAFAALRSRGLQHELVIAGRRGWLFEPIFRRVAELDLTESVRFLEPDDDALLSLYNGADVFVYPSLYEGFGIPPLEALACGAPVACSNTSSLPEVVADAAITFDPREPEQIAVAIERLASDAGLRADLRERGYARAKELTWDRAAEQTVRLYREVPVA